MRCAHLGSGVERRNAHLWSWGNPWLVGQWARPEAEHPEIGNKCRLVYQGTGREPRGLTTRVGLPRATAEARQPGRHRLRRTEQEGTVTVPAKIRTRTRNHDRAKSRVNLSPCRGIVELHGKERRARTAARATGRMQGQERIGTHRTLEVPRSIRTRSEPEPRRCDVPTTPDPPGCVKLEILSNPPLNVHQEYEGHLEPLMLNSRAKWAHAG